MSPPTERKALPTAVTFDVEPVRLSPLYRLGLMVVAVAMLLLPLIYLGLVGVVGYLTWYHTLNNHVILAGGGGIGRVVAYVGPIVVGSLGVLFMVKPLFAPKRDALPPRTVSRDEQPLLHAYVEALCASLGAPMPRRIDVDMQVNASASFRRGVGSFLGNDLVLTLGLPLTAGMSLGQLTGVLAHEFGHFTQGMAMRFSYVIGSVNHWFARVVFERDAWDERLERWIQESSTGWGTTILAVSKGFIWLSRKVLWLLMHVGGVVSGFMSRQMEYNADLHQARVSGADLFRETHLRLPLLGAAWSQTTGYLGEMWRERRLVDDVVALFLVEVRRLSDEPEVMEQIEASVKEQETGTFDTHPSTGDRIRAIEKGSHQPRLVDPRSASILFEDFEELCAESTRAFYEVALGEPAEELHLIPVVQAVADLDGRIESGKALSAWFQEPDLLSLGLAPSHPVQPSGDVPAAAAELEELRDRMAEAGEKVRDVIRRLDEVAGSRTAAAIYVRTLDAGLGKNAVRLDPLRLEPDEDPVEHLVSVATELRSLRGELEEEVEVATQRMDVALAVASSDQVGARISRCSDALGRLPQLSQAARSIADVWSDLRVINRMLPELGVLMQIAGSRVEPGPLLDQLTDVWTELHRRLSDLHRRLEGVAYPYDHAEAGVRIGAYAIPELSPEPGPEIGAQASEASQAINALYARIWADLAALALEVEELVGVRPGDAGGSEASEDRKDRTAS
ncbi:MAG: M48 family metallopeptidase [Longimicrobiales bacterium]|nr:M48 family metallopeptidase [Longimicrobiales bacterium]